VAGDHITLCREPNLLAHKVDGVRKLIEAAKARLVHLPPYSPELNSIENGLRHAQGSSTKSRSANACTLWEKNGDALRAFTPQGCAIERVVIKR
jgi:hypothetical protein